MVKKNTDAYFKILERFDPKDQNTSLILREILNEYPFFQSASAYYLKSLMVQGKESFDRLWRFRYLHHRRRRCSFALDRLSTVHENNQ